jgi:outer membrane receptor protein involved in Fe transport
VHPERIATQAVTGHAGAVVSLSQAWKATVSASRGFRAANAFDLSAIGVSGGGGFEISPGRAAEAGAIIGSSDGAEAVATGRSVAALGPESVYAFEAGLRFGTRRVSASATAFDLELMDLIQRRTLLFSESMVGTTISGQEIVRQDAAGRAYVAIDPRPIATRVNVDRARIAGVELDGQVRVGQRWLARAYFAMANGHQLETGASLRRMPPAAGGVVVRWERAPSGLHVEGTVAFARPQTRLSGGDLSDPRIGGLRTRASIASFFNGSAVDLGLVRDGVLVPTGETLAQVQTRVLGDAASAPLFSEGRGFVVLGARAAWRIRSNAELVLIGENLADRNYRLYGSGVDAPGVNLQIRTRVRF